MGIAELSILLLVGIVVLLAAGVPLGLASGFLGVCVAYWKLGERGFFILGQRMYDLTIEHALLAVPLFIFMAMLLERSNIAKDMYDSLNIWLSRTRGGIAIVTAVMAIIMAAMSGIIGGEVVLLGLIALPQMLRLGYNQNLAVGTICASGSLGTMIPPSIVLIIYGVVTDTSIHALFRAAIVPGLMLGGMYIVYIMVRTRMNPSLAPLPESDQEVTWGEKFLALKGLLPPVILVTCILGSIYGGITGITEAAAIGCLGTLLLIFVRGEFSPKLLLEALQRTLRSTGTILWVTFGATCLAGAYSIAGGPVFVANSILGLELPNMGVILMMMLIFLFLGALMDWVGIVLLTMPVFLPIVAGMTASEMGLIGGLDPSHLKVWFGILFCMNMQVSFLSPPFGPAAFYLKSVAPPHIQLTDIFKGFMPFICIQLIGLVVMLAFPEITSVFLD
ncbi:TRAP transporter large permease subunit [Hwanghaeella grinnelliae]|uniref:TRAP transporter large permease protein n=1 Tax=Hwanghaeella grinnelliae TaxID=2500179 RepID=A0A3S2Z524_9PROT|nr:TRAP transporter large permease subunit [Hwanghaeella grinnelliae]RVU34016.1 TRAP transporter large permease subunit [Hwanghaeella grinnelliae]